MQPRYVTRATNVTERTHYLPAFWTALWNPEYYENPRGRRARKQSVWVLNLCGNVVHRSSVEQVFYERLMGIADVTADSFERHAQLLPFDSELTEKAREEISRIGPVRIDMEGCYTALESTPAYRDAMEVARAGTIVSVQQKINVTAFILFLRFRHPGTARLLRSRARDLNLDSWVVLLGHWEACKDVDWLTRQALPLAGSRWIVHRAASHLFPLGDVAAVENETRSRVWVPLSPRVLIEICLDHPDKGIGSTTDVTSNASRSLMRQFRRLCVGHACRQIIFHDRSVLDEWRESLDYRERRLALFPDQPRVGNAG